MNKFLNPTIFIGSFEFREPVTTLTDVIIAITCLIGVFYLTKNQSRATETFTYYKNYFLIFAFGIACGGILGHGLQAYLSPTWKIVGWILSIGGQVFLALASAKHLNGLIHTKFIRALYAFAIILTAISTLLILLPITRSFIIPQIASTTLLIGITLPLQLYHYQKSKNSGSLLIAIGIALLILPAIVFNQQIAINKWFNHMDLAHVLMNISIVIIFLGSKKLALVKK